MVNFKGRIKINNFENRRPVCLYVYVKKYGAGGRFFEKEKRNKISFGCRLPKIDFSKIKKKSRRGTVSKRKRIFRQNFRKIVG